ncbi:hypothetical protein K503DRAFT_713568 [Rhizopogon vinicolor AM-OR11-026]|uniref:BHLH domain-containing protein n=1 Tax=Rhizopogon vinicolor AM-OR11-026 TaxID=1314800 RepID=A0A1B7N829_9AGAM|nr:hypothetical protein K503DRAFT_713568 [Rhizopogon vinicolor AM-OR11-026]
MTSAQHSSLPASSSSTSAQSAPAQVTGPTPNGERIPLQLDGMDPAQVSSLLKALPNLFKASAQGDMTGETAQSLQAVSQAGFFPIQSQHQMPFPGPGIGDPGPSSHPRGPPNLGQLSAIAAAAGQTPPAPPHTHDGGEAMSDTDMEKPQTTPQPGPATSGRSRASRSAAMGTDEWTRQRKDNHKEVERRRRGNINEGINELGRIVPNSSGEKAKGAILQRAVQYIHHLKENEARNIEKWTLEKLLMDQAMGDLQAQLEDMRRLWDEERTARQRAENELDVLRGVSGQAPIASYKSRSRSVERGQDGPSNRGPFGESEVRTELDNRQEEGGNDSEGRPGKRARVD